MGNKIDYNKIRLVIFDVDGVMTDGKIIISNDGNESKNFDVQDGLGLVILQKLGVKIAIITGKTSRIVTNRFVALGLDEDDIFQGQKNKVNAYNSLLKKYSLKDTQIAYMGDDLPDLVLMSKVGLAVAPANAVSLVTDVANYVCKKEGGNGAVREFSEYLLKQMGYYKQVIDSFSEYGGLK